MTWEEIRDEVVVMLADGEPLEDIIPKLEKLKNEMKRPKTMTNEEWFCSLPTEEKAKRIVNIAVNSDCDYITIVEWLKTPHKE